MKDPRQTPVVQLVTQPGRVFRVAMQLTKGHLTRIYCKIRGVRLEAGKNLRVEGRLIIRGPGRVILGNNVRIGGVVTPWTYRTDAVIEIGDDSFVNGASFGAWQKISIGRRCILGRCHIMDTDFHSVSADRHKPDALVRVLQVTLGENVWIGANVGILPGTSVGQDSVVGFGAVCSGSYPSGVVIAGNPARVIRPIDETNGK